MYGIKDVAKLAGVSTGTVSRALNKSGYVSPKTRELVEKAIDKLNYAPNEMARSLSRSRTNIIGLIVPDISHPFFALLTRYIETELYNAGYKTLICNTIQRSKREVEFLDMLKQHLVDGIIMAAHSLDTDCYQKFDAPIIAFDRNLGGKIPCISSDHKKGGRLAAEKLLANGCRNVLQLTSQHTLNSPSQDRHTVFAAVMKEAGVKCTSIELPWNDFDFFPTNR